MFVVAVNLNYANNPVVHAYCLKISKNVKIALPLGRRKYANAWGGTSSAEVYENS